MEKKSRVHSTEGHQGVPVAVKPSSVRTPGLLRGVTSSSSENIKMKNLPPPPHLMMMKKKKMKKKYMSLAGPDVCRRPRALATQPRVVVLGVSVRPKPDPGIGGLGAVGDYMRVMNVSILVQGRVISQYICELTLE